MRDFLRRVVSIAGDDLLWHASPSRELVCEQRRFREMSVVHDSERRATIGTDSRVLLTLIQPQPGEPEDVSPWSVSTTGDFPKKKPPTFAPRVPVFYSGAKLIEGLGRY